LLSIADEKYVAFTTYTGAGVAKAAPVWIADLGDGSVGFVTPSTSWKAKRLANNAKVALQACDGRVNLTAGSEPVTGTAVVSAGDYGRVNQAIKAEYGWQRTMIGIIAKVSKAFGRPGRVSDTAVLVTLD
jgi:PPOX class probable F420-dependent enzyme